MHISIVFSASQQRRLAREIVLTNLVLQGSNIETKTPIAGFRSCQMLIRRSIARSFNIKSSDSQSNKPIIRAPDGTTSRDIN